MKVFVAGATGAIGRPLVAALVAARHNVVGMTSSDAGRRALVERGAEACVVDAFDADAVTAAMLKIRPDAVIEELTSLPKRYTPEDMRAAAPHDRRLRLEAGANVHNAARAAGAKRYIVQSTGFFYAPAAGLATEQDPLAVEATPGVAANVDTYMKIEARVLGCEDLSGVALRYGFFYGPGTYHDPGNGSISEQVRNGYYPVIGGGAGVFSFVHVEDAASATVAALEAEPGIYNVVDSDPVEYAVWLPAFARYLDAPAPPHVNQDEAVQAHGPDVAWYAMRLRGASNAKATRDLDFHPRRLEWL
jgi:nucleoside-diphosphate-sugar epimerase